MKKSNYRIKPYDVLHDIWFLQERVFLCFWAWRGTGRKSELTKKKEELDNEKS